MTPVTSLTLQEFFDDPTRLVLLMKKGVVQRWAEGERGRLLQRAALQGHGAKVAGQKPGRLGPRMAAEPRFFRRRLPNDLLEDTLRNMVPVTIREVDGTGAWVNQSNEGNVTIQVPRRGFNLGYMRMLIHELGHAQFEQQLVASTNADAEMRASEVNEVLILSEVAALGAEREFVRGRTSETEFAQYLEFQAQWLRANEWALAWERQELHQGHARNRPARLWAMEWASARVGFTEILTTATRRAFPELKDLT